MTDLTTASPGFPEQPGEAPEGNKPVTVERAALQPELVTPETPSRSFITTADQIVDGSVSGVPVEADVALKGEASEAPPVTEQ